MSTVTPILYFEERFGARSLVIPGGKLYRPANYLSIRAIAPRGERTHWVLFTVGASRMMLSHHDDECEEIGCVELMMSLPRNWSPDRSWPAHVLQWATRRVWGESWPLDRVIVSEDVRPVPPRRVSYLVLAPSRQFDGIPRVRGRVGQDALVFALYGLTLPELERFEVDPSMLERAPEIIHRWRDMMRWP